MRGCVWILCLLLSLWTGSATAQISLRAAPVHAKELPHGGYRHEVLVVVDGHDVIDHVVLVVEAPPSSFRRILNEYCEDTGRGPAVCEMPTLVDALIRDMLGKTRDFLNKDPSASLREISLKLDRLHEEVVVQVTTEELAVFLARERLEAMEESLLETVVGLVIGDRAAGYLFQSGADVLAVAQSMFAQPFRWVVGKVW